MQADDSVSEPPVAPPAKKERVFFDAVLHPHRSLSPAGFAIVMSCVALAGLTLGTVFLLAGAWPVFGFCGLEIVLLYVLFRLNYREARRHETVRLTDAALVVRRVAPSGSVKTWRFQPYWLRVSIDDPPRHHSQITLTSHGRSLVIGAFLTPAERLELATAIRDALESCRQAPPPCAPA
jgi:uncharacterized membrane protein